VKAVNDNSAAETLSEVEAKFNEVAKNAYDGIASLRENLAKLALSLDKERKPSSD
jgi:hypothetical protein